MPEWFTIVAQQNRALAGNSSYSYFLVNGKTIKNILLLVVVLWFVTFAKAGGVVYFCCPMENLNNPFISFTLHSMFDEIPDDSVTLTPTQIVRYYDQLEAWTELAWLNCISHLWIWTMPWQEKSWSVWLKFIQCVVLLLSISILFSYWFRPCVIGYNWSSPRSIDHWNCPISDTYLP